MKTIRMRNGFFLLFILIIGCTTAATDTTYMPGPYNLDAMYDENQPQPPVITPNNRIAIEKASTAPSDAIILFDGTGLSEWVDSKGNPSKWISENGYMEAVKDAGSILTNQEFGSCQLHIEWATPTTITGSSQDRGNSGVYLMNQYEIQILDSYNNNTYPAGMAASVYGMNPPMVNASRAPGEWQSYDIIFRRPIFQDGNIVKPAVVTVFHNGVLVQDHFEIIGYTAYKKVPKYADHAGKLPISLQDHGNPIRFRNIWIRELADQ